MQIQLILSYDGTPFFGWQKTRMGPSIEEALEQALRRVLGVEVKLEAASRTDRGVHARGQSVSFSLEQPPDLRRLQRSLNAVLPREISVRSLRAVPSDFHPTLSATSKEYHYFFCIGPAQLPIHRLYSWHHPRPLDLALMENGARSLIGTHDFSAFSNERDEDAIRTLERVSIVPFEERLRIEMRGDRFLYKMARNIAGTLAAIGSGKLAADRIPALLQSKQRKESGATAPAHGLFLHEVFYDKVTGL